MMANAFIRTSLLAVGLAGACLVPAASADFAQGSYVVAGSKAAGLSNCVRETGFMRRNHMELIKHQRHVTVHQGIRDTTDSLAGCVSCHVSYDQQHQPVSVYSKGQFCKACHELAAVDLPCFDCHATVPVPPDSGSGVQAVAPRLGGAEVASVPREVEQGVSK